MGTKTKAVIQKESLTAKQKFFPKIPVSQKGRGGHNALDVLLVEDRVIKVLIYPYWGDIKKPSSKKAT
ncbi:predicted protein [Botrytis cinerea T4]|uniref:Uncharacterized protein n=1 Tax=Botryotinia fuckeliana (strain T4) TaxID=999810 RepID=G2XWE2_BOTF4|nr:predicted protein [Botrytis cinerea T4]